MPPAPGIPHPFPSYVSYVQRDVAGVAGVVALQFGEPVIPVGGRDANLAATVVAVPEAAVDKHDLAPRREYQIGAAQQWRR